MQVLGAEAAETLKAQQTVQGGRGLFPAHDLLAISGAREILLP